jgi:hypothetical protein
MEMMMEEQNKKIVLDIINTILQEKQKNNTYPLIALSIKDGLYAECERRLGKDYKTPLRQLVRDRVLRTGITINDRYFKYASNENENAVL